LLFFGIAYKILLSKISKQVMTMLTERVRRKPGRPKSTRPGRVMVSVPADLAPAVKEIARVYRESQSDKEFRPKAD